MFRCLLASALTLALSSLALAQPLTTAFTFQGQLNTAGSPVTGTYDLQFRLYDAVSAGTQIGPTLCSDNIAIAQGTFTTQLDFGAQFTGQQRYLEVAVRQDAGFNCSIPFGFTTLTPRQPLSAAPNAIYSLSAAAASTATNATQLNGQPPSFYTNAANLSGPLPSASLAGAYSSSLNLNNVSNLFTGSFSGSGANLTGIPYAALTGAPTPILLQASSPGSNQTGNMRISGIGMFDTAVSIGSPHTDASLVVAGHSRIADDGLDGDVLRIGGLQTRAALTSESATNILNLDMNFHVANADISSVGAAVRVNGLGSGVAPIQLLTRAAGSTVEHTALMVLESGQVGVGIYPLPGPQFSVQSTGTACAFYGYGADCVTVANLGSGRGLHVTAPSNALNATSDTDDCIVATTNGSSKTAVNGFANQPNSTGGYFSSTATTGVGNGVVGLSNAPSGYAVYALGRFAATGTKNFQIDHPADPEHKYLLHYCTESPEVINFYSGKVTLNQQGEATITLPAYFARINKDPRYLLTPIGAAMPLLHIAEEVSEEALAQGEKAAPTDPAPTCSFTIAGGAPNAKVSWRVDALRNDRWIQSHGAPVEVNKQGPEDGTYQHPDLYNQPAEMGLNAGAATR